MHWAVTRSSVEQDVPQCCGLCKLGACLTVICQVRYWKAVDCCLNSRCVCSRHEVKALQGLQLQFPLLCYALDDMRREWAIPKPDEPLVLQEYIYYYLCCFPAVSCVLSYHQNAGHYRGSIRLKACICKPVAVL